MWLINIDYIYSVNADTTDYKLIIQMITFEQELVYLVNQIIWQQVAAADGGSRPGSHQITEALLITVI